MIRKQLQTGEIETYEHFRSETACAPKTQKAQINEIERNIRLLMSQGDFWSLDLIRRTAAALADESRTGEALYYALHKALMTPYGKYLFVCMK